MQDNQYFTPDIEDIRIGYECERIKTFKVKWDKEGKDEETMWEKWIIPHGFFLDSILKQLRVPYLTKEQIEAEGWRKDNFWKGKDKFEKRIDKNSYYSLTINKDNQIVITKSLVEGWTWVWQPFYSGECKDINTFRYICKLLGI